MQEPVADLLFTLSGGLPRELVRLIRRAVETREAATAPGRGGQLLDGLAALLTAAEARAQQRAVLAIGRSLTACGAREKLLEWAGRPLSLPDEPDAVAARAHFAALLAASEELAAACPGSHADAGTEAGGCLARETSALLCRLATVGQVFMACSTRDDFEQAQAAQPTASAPGTDTNTNTNTNTNGTFAHLASARQNFPLGPDYVLSWSWAARDTWHLGKPPDAAITDRP